MFKTNNQNKNELDHAGRMVLLAAARNDEAAEAAASSPFLFTRVRAAIAAAKREEAPGWLTLLFVARRAIPAMALIAILTAILTVWSMGTRTPAAGYGMYEDALSDTRDPGVEQTILTRNSLSRDEVLSIVVGRNEREKR